jgi:hypothetical protein
MKLTQTLLGSAGLALLLNLNVDAATLSISPSASTVQPGESIAFTVFADDILEGTPLDTGGLSVLFDSALIEITSVALAAPWSSLSSLVVDNAQGTITDIAFGVFTVGVSGNGIALLNFTAKALALGNSDIIVNVDPNNPFVSGADELVLNPATTSASVSAVPVPAAGVFFLTGLLGLSRALRQSI